MTPRDCDSAGGVDPHPTGPGGGDGAGESGMQMTPRGCDSAGEVDPHAPRPPLCKWGRGGASLRVSAAADSGLGAIAGGAGSFGPRERDLLKMERTLLREIESLRAQGEPADELLNEMMAASAKLHAHLEQHQPRGP
jgi:hypothetical protein